MENPREILAKLAAPFAAEDLEWRLQRTFEDSMKGIAVPYVTNRAIQTRLDEVVGPDRWYNRFRPWHGSAKKEAQICGISIFFEDRGWITKWDGAEDTDIEPVKGGLSDSMKRAAVQWGIGRVLYSMATVYVDVEKKGKSWVIKDSARPKLDKAYLDTLKALHLTPAKASGIQSLLVVGPELEETDEPSLSRRPGVVTNFPAGGKANGEGGGPDYEFTVTAINAQPSDNVTQLALLSREGKKFYGLVRGEHPELYVGAKLRKVVKSFKQRDSVSFYMLDSFEVLYDNAA